MLPPDHCLPIATTSEELAEGLRGLQPDLHRFSECKVMGWIRGSREGTIEQKDVTFDALLRRAQPGVSLVGIVYGGSKDFHAFQADMEKLPEVLPVKALSPEPILRVRSLLSPKPYRGAGPRIRGTKY